MLRKLTIVILASVVFSGLFSLNIIAEPFEKLTPTKIPLEQIVPSSPMPLAGDKSFCLIKSDNDDVAWFYNDFTAGDAFAIYMDPAKCGEQDPYPFKITDVHFYLFDTLSSRWPVETRVNIKDLNQGNKCNGPGEIVCFQTFTIPKDSCENLLKRPMNLTIDSLCLVNGPFFLEIMYTGVTIPPYPSLLMTDSATNPIDTCDVWFYLQNYHVYAEWYTVWERTPGYPVMRITGYTKFTGVEEGEEGSITPKGFELCQSYPNPFNNETIIKYNLRKSCHVSLIVYNILGQKVKTLVKEDQEAGYKSVSWDGKDERGKDLASGIYFYQLKAGEFTQTKRMVLLK